MTTFVRVSEAGDARRVEVDTLKDLQAEVGGYIEGCRTMWDDTFAYVDEDGLMKRLSPNPVASIVAGRALVGPVLFCGTPGRDGNDTDIPEGRAIQLAVMCILQGRYEEVTGSE